MEVRKLSDKVFTINDTIVTKIDIFAILILICSVLLSGYGFIYFVTDGNPMFFILGILILIFNVKLWLQVGDDV